MIIGGGTVFYSKRKVDDFKKQERYRESLDYLYGVLERHCKKQGWKAIFKNEPALQEMIDDLRGLRKAQCVKKAAALMRDDSGQGQRPLEPTCIHHFKEASRLLVEAEKIDSTSEARLMLKKANDCVDAIESYARAENHWVERRLDSARQGFRKIKDIHPQAARKLSEIDEVLGQCDRLKKTAAENIASRDFTAAKRNIDEILFRTAEDPEVDALSESIRVAEKAAGLLRSASEKYESDDKASLFQALEDAQEALRVHPEIRGARSLSRKICEKIAGVLYREGIGLKEDKKDLDAAIDKFQEIRRLDVSHPDAEHALEELLDTRRRIAEHYDKGVSCGKDLEAALDSFRRAAGFGFSFKDLDQRIKACEKGVQTCERLVSEAAFLVDKQPPDYASAISRLQEALILYPGFAKAVEALGRARRGKQVCDLLEKARQHLNSSNFRYQSALSAVDQALALEPGYPEAIRVREEIVAKTLAGLESSAASLAGDRKRVTDAIRLVKDVEKNVPLSPRLQAMLEDLEKQEDEARRTYQQGIGRLAQARKADIADEQGREALYREAEELLKKALGLNANLFPLVRPERERLEREKSEWRDLLVARRLFDEKKFEECLKTLGPYRREHLLDETKELLLEVLNELGFGGMFQLEFSGRAYAVVPDEVVCVGRNTESFRENLLAIKLPDVSRKHGKITRAHGRFLYENRPECLHGTMLNGALIDDRAVALKDGDTLGFGFFRDEDDSFTGEAPAACLKIRYCGDGDAPSLAVAFEPCEHPEFCEEIKKAYILMGERFTIGSAPENAIAIEDPSVERVHVVVARRNDRYFVSDADTPGGALVNDEPLTEERALQLGDRIRIGSVEELRITN